MRGVRDAGDAGASLRSGNDADGPAPPEPSGRQHIADDLGVARRARCHRIESLLAGSPSPFPLPQGVSSPGRWWTVVRSDGGHFGSGLQRVAQIDLRDPLCAEVDVINGILAGLPEGDGVSGDSPGDLDSAPGKAAPAHRVRPTDDIRGSILDRRK